jgi:WD40 repeat protein
VLHSYFICRHWYLSQPLLHTALRPVFRTGAHMRRPANPSMKDMDRGSTSYVRSVAFSHDSTRLASSSGDNTVKIWDASSDACLQTLEAHSSAVSSTDLVSILALLYSDRTVTGSQQPVRQGPSISSHNTWVANDAQNLPWLPTEYRPVCSAVSGKCVGIGTGSGKVWICRFK